MHYRKSILTAIVMSGVALVAGPAMAAADPDPAKGRTPSSTDMPPEAMAALQRDLGLSADQARNQQALQAKAIKLDRALADSLGAAFVGSSYDARSGKLVVTVSDAAKAADVKAAGADARVAKHSKAELQATMDGLDAAAGKVKGSGPADRRAGGARKASSAGMTSWYIDTAANVVRVTVEKGKAAAVKAALAKHGDKIVIEESALKPSATWNYMDGGDPINWASCSAGFNLRSSWNGTGYLLTAGHCVAPSSSVYGQGGYYLGPTLESWYKFGADDALVRNDSAGYWVQGPWVDKQTGAYITVRSYTDAPVGTTICKAGITTKWTCGSITGKNETVNVGGYVVHGLTRHNACAEPGDSGGSNVSVSTWAAEGVSSAAVLTSNFRCQSAYGQPNVSWYHPIADSLNYYGPRYGVTTWP